MNDYNEFETIQLISELAREVEIKDRIDWGNLNISEAEAYDLISNQVYEKFKQIEHINGERLVLLATIVKLTVENFVLNLQLMGKVK